MPIDGVDLSDLSMPTMFDNAAASLRTHLSAQIAAVIELGVQIGSDHETIEGVLGWAADDGIEKWSPIPLEPLVLSVLAAYRRDRSTAFPVGSPEIADLAANNAAHCACLSVPIYDVDGVGRLLLLICSPDEHSIFGRPEVRAHVSMQR